MVELVATKACGFQGSAPSSDRKNIERHPDGLPVSRDYKLAWVGLGQEDLAPKS